MTRRASTGLVGFLACVALTACQGSLPPPKEGGGASADAICEEVDEALLRGQRNSFGLNFQQAEDAFTELLSLYALEEVEAICPTAPSRAFVLMNQALTHSSQERFVTARGLFESAEALLAARPADDRRLERDRALLAAYRAQDRLNRSVLEGAGELVEQAALSFGDVSSIAFGTPGSGNPFAGGPLQGSGARSLDLIEAASNQHTLSHIRLLEGDLEGAERAIDRAIDLISLAPEASIAYRPRFLYQRSLIRLEQGDVEASLEDAAVAADQFAAMMPDTPLEARARLRQGRALVALGRGEEALSVFDRAFRVYEEQPVVVEYASLWPFFALSLEISEDQPERREEMGARAFRAAQLVRQSITAQTISNATALLGEGDDEKAAAVRAWRDARERYSTLKALQVLQLRHPLTQDDQARVLAAAVSEAQAELERATRRRDEIAPEYKTAVASPASLDEIQGVLEKGEALVQILPGRPSSFLILVDGDGISFSALPVSERQVAVLVSLLRRGVETDREGRVPAFRTDLAHQLFNLLFPGYRDRLLSYDRLIFSTSGALQSLPLELLVTSDPGEGWRSGDYSSVEWLGALKSVSYVPTPRNLLDIRTRAGTSKASRPIASFSDFRAGVDPRKVLKISRLPETCLTLAEAVDRVGELPGTAKEAQVLRSIFGETVRVRTGSEFNEDAVKAAGNDGTLSDYRVLHFATHGILWPTADCFTDPALTVTATDSEDSDGLLTATEIRLMDFDAQLVVLSACNTASGYLTGLATTSSGAEAAAGASGAGGESLSGLARAFFAAGTRTVLATHWPVADDETTDLMDRLFRNLEEGRVDFGTALQAAQSELRSAPQTSHPVFWAPFVLIGDSAQTLGDQEPS